MMYPNPRPDRVPEHHKTDWYPASINPARPGFYEVGYGTLPRLHHSSKGYLTGNNIRYWDGVKWRCGHPDDPWGKDTSIFGTHPAHHWRGLKEQYAYEHH